MRNPIQAFYIAAVVLAAAPSLGIGAASEGTATFRFKTEQKPGQRQNPKHVLAAWVTDAEGRFVRTLMRRGSRREGYLYSWGRSTARNTVDAVTGATVRSHRTHVVVWDGRDLAGSTVPDGSYAIRVEFTAAHEQGPLTPRDHIVFDKGPKEVNVRPADLAHFKNMSLTYRPTPETEILIQRHAVWKYEDTGVDLHATDWSARSYDDSKWSAGKGVLGYGDEQATLLGFGSDSENRAPCAYFRHTFRTTYVPASLKLRLLRDDGAVVYLNGTEVARQNMAPGVVRFSDLAIATVGKAEEKKYYEQVIDAKLIVVGTNVLAVEVHQAPRGSVDLSFDAELRAAPQGSTAAGEAEPAGRETPPR